MLFINSFLFCGLVCLIAQIILDNTKLTPGHITSMFVVIGAFLDSFSLYDLEKQEEVLAGGSGPVCSALVNFGYVFDELKKKKLKRVLLVATGALFSSTMVYQKQNINSIAHAISLEVV